MNVPAPSPLVDQLAHRIDVLSRIRLETRCGRARAMPERLNEVLSAAHAAIASGDEQAMEAALLSMGLLSLELCDE